MTADTNNTKGSGDGGTTRTGAHNMNENEVVRQQKAYLQIGLIVGQVNRVELELNELIVEYFVKEERANDFSKEVIYSDKLSLHSKLKIAIFIMAQLNVTVDKKALEEWKSYRNMVAHGILGYNKKTAKSELLYNGKSHVLDSTFKGFGTTHDIMIAMIEKARKEARR